MTTHRRPRATLRYTLYGGLFGLLFPILAITADLILQGHQLSVPAVLRLQQQNPLHYVVDTVPVLLAVFAWFAGRREDQSRRLTAALQEQIAEREQTVENLERLQASLQQQVRERTAALARRSHQLQAAAYVAREAAAIQDLERLLDEMVRLISDRFSFYHVGIFLVDDAAEFAVLRAASSEGGQRMLERGHRLKVGQAGIVGHAARTGEPRISPDVADDLLFLVSPELAYTRSEMALPLKVRGRVIGVLDVQSEEEGAFTEEDLAILLTLTDQVALAIENTRLLRESGDHIREVERLLGRYRKDSWRALALQKKGWTYSYDGVDVLPKVPAKHNGNGADFFVPIHLRDEPIGQLGITMEGREPTPDDIALARTIANQTSLALESAWLFQEAQRRATRDQISSEISAALRASLDIDSVLRAAVREMGDRLKLAEVQIRVGSELALMDQANPELSE
jgi:GAF domain-containing protein